MNRVAGMTPSRFLYRHYSRHHLAVSLAVLGAIVCGLPAPAGNPKLDQGIREYNAGHYTEAVSLLNVAQTSEFNNPILHYYLANALAKINMTKDAIKEYKVAMALQPEGQMADYCQKALDQLAATGGTKTGGAKGSSIAPKLVPGTNTQQPQVMFILCGCPLCHRLELQALDLQTKYGDKVAFSKITQTSTDPKDMDILMKFAITSCPTVLFFNSQGQLVNRVSGVIPDTDILKNTADLASSSPRTASKEEQRAALQKTAINSQLESALGDDQRRMDSEIAQIQTQLASDIASMPRYQSSVVAQIRADAEKRIAQIKADFERRKRERYAEAAAKASASSSYSYNPAQPKTPESMSPTLKTYGP